VGSQGILGARDNPLSVVNFQCGESAVGGRNGTGGSEAPWLAQVLNKQIQPHKCNFPTPIPASGMRGIFIRFKGLTVDPDSPAMSVPVGPGPSPANELWGTFPGMRSNGPHYAGCRPDISIRMSTNMSPICLPDRCGRLTMHSNHVNFAAPAKIMRPT